MQKYLLFFVAIGILTIMSCTKKEDIVEMKMKDIPSVSDRLKAFAEVKITADISFLTEREKKMVEFLIEAGKIADEIFWKQNSVDGIAIREELKKNNSKDHKDLLRFLNIWYEPYDAMYEQHRFVGSGTMTRPKVANLYPQDLTKAEFEKFIKDNPAQKNELESQYTVVTRENGKLMGIPYYKAYPEMLKMADYLDKAAEYCDNPSLKNYLVLRAKALRTDDYYESDMAWMDIKDSDVDLVIGPIENYIDGLFNYKTAFEAVVMVKDKEASKQLDMFRDNIDFMEHSLPYDKKYIRPTAGSGNVLQVMNVVYFGGDCNGGTKTIAASLPNDPKVIEQKGGKKSMYKNIMEAKFDKILVPIADKILSPELVKFVDKTAFTNFVTLHEVSHTLGRSYVYGNDNLSVRKALQERYSSIEECKADILGMYNHKVLLGKGLITKDYYKKVIATYIAGLYRSIRFGAEEAHGKANVIQLNFLIGSGAVKKDANGKLMYDSALFDLKVAELAGLILTIQAEGDYKEAGEILDKYGKISDDIKSVINSLKDVPRDIDNQQQ